MYWQQWETAFWIFCIAAGTDVLDGHFARVLKEQTNLGRVLDPLADKILIVATFSALAFIDTPLFHIPLWFVVLVFVREGIIILGSCIIMRKRHDVTVESIIWGKLTTLFQVLFITWLFVCYFIGWDPEQTFGVVLVLLALFSILSLFQYVKKGVLYLAGV